jgi:hypothetical protein
MKGKPNDFTDSLPALRPAVSPRSPDPTPQPLAALPRLPGAVAADGRLRGIDDRPRLNRERGGGMSRSLLRCRNLACPTPHGAVLGRVTIDGGLVLEAGVRRFAVYLDTRRAVIACPACGTTRTFSGRAICSE